MGLIPFFSTSVNFSSPCYTIANHVYIFTNMRRNGVIYFELFPTEISIDAYLEVFAAF